VCEFKVEWYVGIKARERYEFRVSFIGEGKGVRGRKEGTALLPFHPAMSLPHKNRICETFSTDTLLSQRGSVLIHELLSRINYRAD
jgi:hypothetical protein